MHVIGAEGSNDALVALIGALGTVCVAAIAIIPILLQQRRTHRKVDAIYDNVNRVEDDVGTGQGAHRTLREEMRDGFTRNDDAHEKIGKRIDGVQKRVRGIEKEIG